MTKGKPLGFGKLISLAEQIFSEKNKISDDSQNWEKLVWIYTHRSFSVFKKIFDEFKNDHDETAIILLTRNLFFLSVYIHYIDSMPEMDKEKKSVEIIKWDQWEEYKYHKNLEDKSWSKFRKSEVKKPSGTDPFKNVKAITIQIDEKNETFGGNRMDSFSFLYELLFSHASMHVHERIGCKLHHFIKKEGEVAYIEAPKFHYQDFYIHIDILMFMMTLLVYNNVFNLGFSKKMDHLQNVLLKDMNKKI